MAVLSEYISLLALSHTFRIIQNRIQNLYFLLFTNVGFLIIPYLHKNTQISV